MAGRKKKITQVCKCENCGNEAEMVITCALGDETSENKPSKKEVAGKNKVKGVGTCSTCGNEAEMWIDM
jgi:DNA-directed RNA polymerase subunit M/transcription elongation factor TFIIS